MPAPSWVASASPFTVRTTAPDDRLSVVRSSGSAVTYAVTRTGPVIDSDPTLVTVTLPTATSLSGFTSSWGLEYQPVRHDPGQPVRAEVTSGRSTQGAVPWWGVETDEGAYVITLHWSGNWRLEHRPTADGSTIRVALHPDGQRVTLGAGAALTMPEVTVAWGDDLTAAAESVAHSLAAQVPPGPPALTEWNHWWPYEDAEIDEETFLANAAVAADLGVEVAVLDAGWFGRSAAGSEWFAERGDWHRVNTARFPHGLAWLADQTRRRGVEFGIWIEAEAVGVRATIATERPDLLATAPDGRALGYVCLGSPAGREHVLRTVAALVAETDARWVKWDFNLDPGVGCGRTDHGHHGTDGLLQHYLGLYQTLDRLRAEFPDTVVEACSSGGLRVDAGLAAHVDALFLSDPDWTEHHLCCLWGAARMLPPRQLLHWPQSEWRGEHRFQHVDYSGTLITRGQFDTKITAALLHRFGISVRLTQMRPDLLERLRAHVTAYTTHIRPVLEHGELVGLTEQPLREERGCRQPAFQLHDDQRALVAGFRLEPRGDWQPIRPRGLDPDADYRVHRVDGADLVDEQTLTGAELIGTGLTCTDPEATSVLWLVRRG